MSLSVVAFGVFVVICDLKPVGAIMIIITKIHPVNTKPAVHKQNTTNC